MFETLKKSLVTGVLGIVGCGMMTVSAQEAEIQQTQGGVAQWKDPISNPVFNDNAMLKRQLDIQFIWESLASHIRPVTGPFLNMGADMNVGLVQLEYPINKRWAFILNKAGYIDFNPSGDFNKREGLANISGGFKYGLPTQMESCTFAFRTTLEAPTGDDEVFQDGRGSISPAFLATYEMDRFAFNGVLGGILPFDGSEDSSKAYMSFDCAAKVTKTLSSHLEINWFRVVEPGNGDATYDSQPQIQTASYPSAGHEGGDLFNLGAENADEHPDLVTGTLGVRYQIMPNINLGVAYGITLTHPHQEQSLMDERVTANVSMRF